MDADVVSQAFQRLQDGLCQTFSAVGGGQAWYEDLWQYEKGTGGGRTRVWSEAAGEEKSSPRPSGRWMGDGPRRGLWSRAACSFSDIQGSDLPAAALKVRHPPFRCADGACQRGNFVVISLFIFIFPRTRSSIRASRFRFVPLVCRSFCTHPILGFPACTPMCASFAGAIDGGLGAEST